MVLSQHLNLVPPLIQAGKHQDLLETGQTLKSAFCAANNSLAIYLSNVVRSSSCIFASRHLHAISLQETRLQQSADPEEQLLYFACTDPIPSSARRLVSLNSFVFLNFPVDLLCSLSVIRPWSLPLSKTLWPPPVTRAQDGEDAPLEFTYRAPLIQSWSSRLQSDSRQSILRKLAIDYINHIKECWIHASVCEPHYSSEAKSLISMSIATHQSTGRSLTIPQWSLSKFVHLFRLVYGFVFAGFWPGRCTGGGRPDGVAKYTLYRAFHWRRWSSERIGASLGRWHFLAISHKVNLSRCFMMARWKSIRATLRGLSKASIFFLDTLTRHPSEDLQRLAKDLVPLIDSQPRLQHFSTERDYAYASRRWRDRVKTLRLALDRVPEVDRHDSFENWWDRFSDIVGALEGREDVIRKICDENGGDWKEVCIAWSTFVDVRMRRQDLP